MSKTTNNEKEKVDPGFKNLVKMFPFYKKFWKLMLAIIIFVAQMLLPMILQNIALSSQNSNLL